MKLSIIAPTYSTRTSIGRNDGKSDWITICSTTSFMEQIDHVSTVFIWLWAIGSISSSICAMVRRILCLSRFICISDESLANRWYKENMSELSYSQETTSSFVNQDGIAIVDDSLDFTCKDQPLRFLYSCFLVFSWIKLKNRIARLPCSSWFWTYQISPLSKDETSYDMLWIICFHKLTTQQSTDIKFAFVFRFHYF